MKIAWRVAFLLTVVVCLLLSQPSAPSPGQLNYSVQTWPGPIPYSSMTDIVRGNAWVCSWDMTGLNQTITIQDRQPTPVPFMSWTFQQQSTAIGAYSSDGTCRFMPNGISIQASAAGVTGSLRIKCPASCQLVGLTTP